MLLSYPLPLHRQLFPLLTVSLNFGLYVLLVASRVHKPLSATLNVQILLVQPLHFQLNQLVFKLIQLNFCIHRVNLVSQLTHHSFNFFNVILDFCGNPQK